MIRSVALIESARFPSERQVGTVAAALESPDPLLRMNAATALSFLAAPQRLRFLQPLLADPAKSVRMAVARQLMSIPLEQAPSALRSQLSGLLAEYQASLLFNADTPESMSELGLFYAARGDLGAAEEALLHARRLTPHYLAAMLNLADVYRAQGRDDLGEPLLEEARAAYPDSGDVSYALGLLYVRTDRKQESVALFEHASRLSPGNAQYVLVYAVALAETGNLAQSVTVLENAAKRFSGNEAIHETLDAYRNR